jgi:peptidoglycan/xylan/chitin deacetylase (PgdA/CDA1 family)
LPFPNDNDAGLHFSFAETKGNITIKGVVPMATVVVSVDCAAANQGRCYTPELVRVAEEFHVPMTWLITVSANDPMSNVMLYHAEYLHRIPSWHEIGLRVHFQSNGSPITDERERGMLIQEGKDLLKQCHVKPTAFRAADHMLQVSDLRYLEDIGIVVDGTVAPGVVVEDRVDWSDAPTQPYHPAYDNLKVYGDAKLLLVPVATYRGQLASLDMEWGALESILDYHLQNSEVISITARDWANGVANWRRCVQYLRERGCRFVTLSQVASEWGR